MTIDDILNEELPEDNDWQDFYQYTGIQHGCIVFYNILDNCTFHLGKQIFKNVVIKTQFAKIDIGCFKSTDDIQLLIDIMQANEGVFKLRHYCEFFYRLEDHNILIFN